MSKHENMVRELMDSDGDIMSEWEVGLIEAIFERVGFGRIISGNQAAKIEQIWHRVFG